MKAELFQTQTKSLSFQGPKSQEHQACQCVKKCLYFCVFEGKSEIRDFLAAYPDITHCEAAVYTKVFNEQRTVQQRGAKRLQQLTDIG